MAPTALINIPRRTDSYNRDQDLPGSPGHDGLSGYPVKEQAIYAVHTAPGSQKVTRLPVVLKAYVSNFGSRYIVVAQDKRICRDYGYINLRHCIIKSGQDQDSIKDSVPVSRKPRFTFQIVSTKNDGQTMTFEVESSSDLDQWLQVLTEDDQEQRESPSPKFVLGSPIRRLMGELSATNMTSPRLGRKPAVSMPVLEEE